MTQQPLAIDLLRIGNPWMVGHNVERIVPVLVINNLCARSLEADNERLQGIRDMARGSSPPFGDFDCFDEWHPESQSQLSAFQDTLFAVLAPDRRLFRARKGSASGSLTPLLSNLVEKTPSDDGLGKRMYNLLRQRRGLGWEVRLRELLTPSTPQDPATSLAWALLQPSYETINSSIDGDSVTEPTLTDFEDHLVGFVDNLIVPTNDARRLQVIQEVGRGLYFGALLMLLSHPVHQAALESGNLEKQYVFVFAGMPPGQQTDPMVLAAARSFSQLVANSWNEMVFQFHAALKRVTLPSGVTKENTADERFRSLLMGIPGTRLETILDQLRTGAPSWDSSPPTTDWCASVFEGVLAFPRSEYARRIRNLGRNIGFSGPDRGKGHPRFFCETPLLGTLTRGVGGGRPMSFEKFVTEMRTRFGLVFGPGDDDDLARKMGPIWGGEDGESILLDNQEELRRRMVRVGLARTYSDSHTEVFPNA